MSSKQSHTIYSTLLGFISILHVSEPILTRNPHIDRRGSFYLDNERPLWILEDQVPNRHEIQNYSSMMMMMKTSTMTPYFHPNFRRQNPMRNSKTGPKYSGYLRNTSRINLTIPIQKQQQQSKQQFSKIQAHHLLPIFENSPGNEILETIPIFIYSGPKGELILNTMLSSRRYPMQEPVPGDILHPPNVPLFHPRPLVQRFRENKHPPSSVFVSSSSTSSSLSSSPQIATLNLTYIPFYAHEAIDPRSNSLDMTQDMKRSSASSEQQLQPVTVLYAAPDNPTTIPTKSTATTLKPLVKKSALKKRRRSKKTKLYTYFRSPNEVHWQPAAIPIPIKRLPITSITTPFPLTLPSPLHNHRFVYTTMPFDITSDDSLTNKYIATPYSQISPTAATVSLSEIKGSDELDEDMDTDHDPNDDDAFRILTVDESLEKPIAMAATTTTTQSPLNLKTEYYAFPVYTLGKLLHAEGTTALKESIGNALNEQNAGIQVEETSLQRDKNVSDEDTLFVLNSRYKGGYRNHRNNNDDHTYRLSSKYTSLRNIKHGYVTPLGL